jgi:hypothetical protein
MKKPNKEDYWGEIIQLNNGTKEQLFEHEDYQRDLENYIEYLENYIEYLEKKLKNIL